MAIYRHTTDLPAAALGAVVAIGNFDGVHRGHQAVIAETGRLARALGAGRAVLTFEPHPRQFFQPEGAPFRLTSFRLKVRLLEALGIEDIFCLTFNRALSRLSAEDFVRDILVRELRVRHVVVGENFAFGHRRQGDVAFLEARGRELGFGVTVLRRVAGPTAEIYSSTAVRDHLKAGDPTRAGVLLGRYWEIEGRVQPGARLGRSLGFPTANVALGELLEPAFGVYAVRAGVDRGERTVWRAGVANLGTRPTVDGQGVLLEAHLFDADEDLYGQHLRVAMVEYLRPEWRFDDLEAMCAQMAEDARRARVILAGETWQADWPAAPFMAGPAGPGDPDAAAPARAGRPGGGGHP